MKESTIERRPGAERAPETEAPETEAAPEAAAPEPAAPEAAAPEAEAARPESESAPAPAPQTAAPGKKKKTKPSAAKRAARRRIVRLVLLGYLVVLAAAALLLDGRHALVQLNGPETMTVELGEPFVDPGARAWSDGRVFGRSRRAVAVDADRSVDTTRPGETVLRYSASVFGKTTSVQRTVHVADTTPPVITLEPDGAMTDLAKGFVEPGYHAEDNADGDLTDRVEVTQERGRVVYTVHDSAGNEARAERELHYNVSTPELWLVGGGEITLPAAMRFQEPGYRAVDALGNDLTDRVVVSGDFTPYAAGSYELRYTVENDDGGMASARRRVTVTPLKPPATVLPDTPTIYLTFDDGPGPYTARLLDLLQRYDVKATFFVTEQFEGYEDMIGRAYREGHAVGVHSLTHSWSIYNSEEAYFKDFLAMEEIVKEQTGSYTKLFRFPGGSSNTVSRRNKGIMTRLARDMTDMGYVYFDWNVSSGDAGETTSTAEVVQNVCAGCRGRDVSVVLQHDIKDFSVDAVEQIILWGQRNGYTFAALDETSFPAHHDINN